MDDLHLLQEMERPFYVLIQVMGIGARKSETSP